MKNQDLMYHLIDWILAILLAFPQFKQGNYILVIFILGIAFLLSLIFLLLYKNKCLKMELSVYESLLKYPIPLYGLINYIAKQKTIFVDYMNTDIHLDELSLKVKLAGNISSNKNNDLLYDWTFIGKNTSRNEIGNFFLRIGGDSASAFNNLQFKCIDCSQNIKNCKYLGHLHKCPIDETCSKKGELYFTKIDIQDSKTLYLININFADKLKEHTNFNLKVSYIWPQCYNCNYDFLLIDPNNFAQSVKKIRITIEIDNLVIKSTSKVQLFSIKRNSSKIENEKQVKLSIHENCFSEFFEVESDKIYFVIIENT